MKKTIDYKNAVELTNKFLRMRRKLVFQGIPLLTANAMTATRLAFPFAGKDTMSGFEWELNARIVLNVVEAMLCFKDN
jgi:hypothetical protein